LRYLKLDFNARYSTKTWGRWWCLLRLTQCIDRTKCKFISFQWMRLSFGKTQRFTKPKAVSTSLELLTIPNQKLQCYWVKTDIRHQYSKWCISRWMQWDHNCMTVSYLHCSMMCTLWKVKLQTKDSFIFYTQITQWWCFSLQLIKSSIWILHW
jgi:hypothetical protein